MGRAIVVVVLLAAASAHGEPQRKSRTTALTLSSVGAGVSGALVITSFFTGDTLGQVNMPLLYTGVGVSTFAPSAGEWYAGEWLSWGMGVRAIAGATAIVITQTQTQTRSCSAGVGQCTSLSGNGVALLGLAGIAYIGGIAYDVIDAGDAVDHYNRAHGFTFSVTPVVAPTPSGTAPMMMFSGRW